jgi:hypothetical protein
MYASSILLVTIPATLLYFQAEKIKEKRKAAQNAADNLAAQIKEHGAESTQAALAKVTAEDAVGIFNAAIAHPTGKILAKLLKCEPLSLMPTHYL